MTALQISESAPPQLDSIMRSDVFPARIDVKEQVMDIYSTVLTGLGWIDEADKSWWLLSLEELITNAILHGNEGDPDLNVRMSLGTDGISWILVITDEGDGFDADGLPSADDDDDSLLLREHGRGILLVREWVDDLSYFDSGRTARLERRRHDVAEKA